MDSTDARPAPSSQIAPSVGVCENGKLPIGAADSAKQPRKWLLAGVQLLGSGVFLWLSFSQVHVDELVARLGQLSAPTLISCTTLTVLQFVLLVERWRILVHAAHFQPQLRPLVIGTLGERLVNQVLPSTLGGDALRAVQLLAAGAPKGTTFLSILADRGAGILGMLFLCASLSVLGLVFGVARDIMVWCLVLGVAAAIGVWASLTLLKPHWLMYEKLPLRSLRMLAVEGLQLAKTRAFAWAAGPLSMTIQGVFVAIYILLAHDIAPEIDLLSVLVLAPVVLLTAVIPITVSGWGLRETAAIGLFAGVGVSAAAALSVSVAFGILQSAIGLVCGCVLMVFIAMSKTNDSERK
jgi:glycosyltransferase 2 family protein